nr:PqqD family peptide modification chaperone [Halomonas elongata]
MPGAAQFRRASPRRKLNHIPGNAALTVKSRLADGLMALRERIRESGGDVQRLDFFPRSYSMPRDYHALQDAAAESGGRWILKPTNASKGKGIRVLREATDVPLAPNWLVQEYLDHPHTIRGHKYVLRLYVLIAGLEPLRVYLYRQGFAKLASEPWDPEDADNPFSQLTNPDINALNDRAEVPVEFIDLERYRAGLREQGHDDTALFSRIEDLVTLTVLSAVGAMRRQTARVGGDPRGCYELLGLDCLVDDTLKPWILECNLSPSLGICAAPDNGGRIEAAVKGDLVRDLISLVDIPGSHETVSADVESVLADVQAEQSRAGLFTPLWPSREPERYLPFFALPSPADFQLAEGMAGRPIDKPTLKRRRVAELVEGDQLALYATDTGDIYRPNETAAMIWLLATEGLDLDAIADTLVQAFRGEEVPDDSTVRRDVWTTLEEWCQAGLLCQACGADSIPPAAEEVPTTSTSMPLHQSGSAMRLDIDGKHWILEAGSDAAMERLSADWAAYLSPLEGDEPGRGQRLSVLSEPHGGYALATDQALVATRLTLDQVMPALISYLLRQAAEVGRPSVDVDVLMTGAGEGVLCLFSEEKYGDDVLRALHGVVGAPSCRGARLVLSMPGQVEPLALPIPNNIETESTSCLAAVTLRGLLVIEDETTNEPTSLLSSLDVLTTLLPRLCTHDESPLDGTGVQALAAWLTAVPCYRLAGESSLESLSDWLESLSTRRVENGRAARPALNEGMTATPSEQSTDARL